MCREVRILELCSPLNRLIMLECAAKCRGVRMLEQWGKHFDKLRKEHGGVGPWIFLFIYPSFMV